MPVCKIRLHVTANACVILVFADMHNNGYQKEIPFKSMHMPFIKNYSTPSFSLPMLA